MKVKDPGHVQIPVAVACGQLLKQVHVSELQLIMSAEVQGKTCKKTVTKRY